MDLTQVLIFLATGLVAGFASGLLGLGGAFILVPVQYIVYVNMGLSADLAMKIAAGTSLMVVLPTALRGAWNHYRAGFVWWRTAVIMGCVSALFSYAGATLAAYLPGPTLKIIFGGLVIANAVWLIVMSRLHFREKEPVCNPWLWAAWAVPIGFVSGLLGVGGGIMALPIMLLALHFKEHNTVGNSLAMITITSAGGIVGYIINGWAVNGLPDYSLGYIYLPAWAILAVSSILVAPLGARLSHRFSGHTLRLIIVSVMVVLGLQMLGVFRYLGLP